MSEMSKNKTEESKFTSQLIANEAANIPPTENAVKSFQRKPYDLGINYNFKKIRVDKENDNSRG